MSDRIEAITMPKWGLAMEDGMVVVWLAEEGGSIAAGDEIMEIETTKITNVYEAPVAGTLRRRIVAEGETVPVGALLGLLAEPSVPDGEIDAFIARFGADFADKAAEAKAATPEPKTVTVGGLRLNTLRMGPEGGVPLVLIHGFGGGLDGWLFNQPALAASHDVLALDLPGHGRSSKEVGAADMAMLIGVFAGLLDAVGIGRAYLIGHSMGAAVALLFAMKNPGRVTGLTVVAPAGLGPEVNMDYIERFIGATRRKEMRAVLELLVADPALIGRDMINEVLKYKRLDGVDQALRRLAEGLFPGGRQKTFKPGDLARIPVPISVIWGRNDRILPVGHADHFPDGVAVHRLDGVGHMPQMEAAAEVNRLIEAAL
jgi:pyruvate dehydrogenase E2 component (dihydrolipoamide acetyltransferase)